MRKHIAYEMLNISYYFILKISNHSIYQGEYIKIDCYVYHFENVKQKRPMGQIAHMSNTGYNTINFMK